ARSRNSANRSGSSRELGAIQTSQKRVKFPHALRTAEKPRSRIPRPARSRAIPRPEHERFKIMTGGGIVFLVVLPISIEPLLTHRAPPSPGIAQLKIERRRAGRAGRMA